MFCSSLNNHPICAAMDASRYFLIRTATPPVQEGPWNRASAWHQCREFERIVSVRDANEQLTDITNNGQLHFLQNPRQSDSIQPCVLRQSMHRISRHSSRQFRTSARDSKRTLQFSFGPRSRSRGPDVSRRSTAGSCTTKRRCSLRWRQFVSCRW